MGNPQNVELEAAKFLHKLIQESKDEPTKLATKLFVILQHMKSSGKENSMPYQVISRAMETVIKENNLDIETLMSSRLPLTAGPQIGDSASSQLAGGAVKPHGVLPGATGSYLSAESATRMQFGNSSVESHGFAAMTSKDRGMEVFPAIPSGDHSAGKSISGKTLDHGGSTMVTNANKGCSPSSLSEPNVLRTTVSRDSGKAPLSQASSTKIND